MYKRREAKKSNGSDQEKRVVERHPEERREDPYPTPFPEWEHGARYSNSEADKKPDADVLQGRLRRNNQGELGRRNSCSLLQSTPQGVAYHLHFPNTLWSKSARKSWVYFNMNLEKQKVPPLPTCPATAGLPQNWKGSKEVIQPFTSNPLAYFSR